MSILGATIVPHPLLIIPTVERQIDIARQKGGISSQKKCTLERFEVAQHT